MFASIAKTFQRFFCGRKKINQIFQSDLIGLCFSSTDGQVLDANDCYLDMLAVTREQMNAGQVNWRDFTDPQHKDRSVRAAQELRETGKTRPFEKDYINARGERVTVLVGAQRIDENTNLGFVLDLSKSKIGERLSQSERFLESVVENIPNMIFVKEAKNLSFVRFNKAGEELVGHPRTAMIGKTDYDFFPKEQADYFTDKDREVIRNKRVVDIPEEPIHTPAGTRFLHTKKIPVFDRQGNPLYLMGISEDITERKEAEQQKIALLQAEAAREEAEKSAEKMAHLTDKANDANRAKSAFLANISHEIRTPLGAMLGFAELALESQSLEKKNSYMMTVLRNGHELLRIVDEVLDLSKAESNSMEIEAVRFSLQEFLKDLCSLMEVQAKQKGLELNFNYATSLPEFMVSDPYRLRQVLLNIIGNAIKFTEKGSVTVDTKTAGNLVQFTVTDTGIGITPEHAEKLFKPFAQADDSTTRKFGGTGLGLYLSRRLAGLLGGDVKILSSKANEGSRFEVSALMNLKTNRQKVVLSTDANFVSNTTESRPEETTSKENFKEKILVVDDSLDNQELIAAYLSSDHINYSLASRGIVAVEMADESYSAILMDIQMPEMDGFEALQRIRSKGLKIPIVAITAHAMKGDRERCFEGGFDDYLSKPISRKALNECLKRIRESQNRTDI